MSLYKIYVRHFSQKDSHESVECFLVAESDDEVYLWLDEKQYGLWSDRNDEDGLIDIYDDDYNVIGTESYKENMIRINGEFFDEELELEDLYYGKTIYGWKKMNDENIIIKTQSLRSLEMLEVAKK